MRNVCKLKRLQENDQLQMASIKQRIIKCLADYATLYSDLQHEIVKCTKSLSDLGGNSQLGLLEQQIDTQKQRVSGVVDALIEKDKELQILLRERTCYNRVNKNSCCKSRISTKDSTREATRVRKRCAIIKFIWNIRTCTY
jgi:hypothetical protein